VATEDTGRSKRRRFKTNRFENDVVDNDEARLIQRAIENSKKETERVCLETPEAPVFRPSVEEFRNPLQYINRWAHLPPHSCPSSGSVGVTM
jgi:hypothetical protein